MTRYLILAAAVVMQMCLGATYAWSIFVAPIKNLTGMSQGAAQLPYTAFYFAFPITTVFAGLLLARFGPRPMAVAGGLLFGGGWALAGLGQWHWAFTVAGVGLLGGMGVGMAYLVPISTCILWFPRHKGLVTGLAVAGFGGGAALVAQAGNWLMARPGLTPFGAFSLLGVVFALAITSVGSLIRRPPGVEAAGWHWREAALVLRERVFWALYFAMFAGLMAGFAVNANLRELAARVDAQAAALAVGAFAIANAAGRVAWGFAFDRLGPKPTLAANLALQAVFMIAAGPILASPGGLPLFAGLIGFNYGGVLVLYASTTARRWGAERVGVVYGWLFSANLFASGAPALAGAWYDRFGNFQLPFWLIAAAMLAAVALVLTRRTI